jgi:hypothetical protein
MPLENNRDIGRPLSREVGRYKRREKARGCEGIFIGCPVEKSH